LDINGEKDKANQYKNLCDYASSIETIYNRKFFDTKTINRVQFLSNSHPLFMQDNRRSIHFNQKSCRLCRQFGHISESCLIRMKFRAKHEHQLRVLIASEASSTSSSWARINNHDGYDLSRHFADDELFSVTSKSAHCSSKLFNDTNLIHFNCRFMA